MDLPAADSYFLSPDMCGLALLESALFEYPTHGEKGSTGGGRAEKQGRLFFPECRRGDHNSAPRDGSTLCSSVSPPCLSGAPLLNFVLSR